MLTKKMVIEKLKNVRHGGYVLCNVCGMMFVPREIASLSMSGHNAILLDSFSDGEQLRVQDLFVGIDGALFADEAEVHVAVAGGNGHVQATAIDVLPYQKGGAIVVISDGGGEDK